MGVTPQDPRGYVVNAGRTGPYRFFDSDFPVFHYSALAVLSAIAGWIGARSVAPWGVLVTTVVYAAAIATTVLLCFGALGFQQWWRGELHFRADDEALVFWYGTSTRRGLARRVSRGAQIVASVVAGRIETLALSGFGRRATLGRMWDVYPREFERWAAWARRMGWEVDATGLDAEAAADGESVRVGAEWQELPMSGEAESVWIVPHGPSSASYLVEQRDDWLPEENVDEVGESFAPAGAAHVESIALRIAATLDGGGGIVEFGAAAGGAVVYCDGAVFDAAFEEGIDASHTRITSEGRLEVTFRKAR